MAARVSVETHIASLRNTLLRLRPRELNSPYTFGLAVSGGSDSMCLAALAAQLQKLYPQDFKFNAFIVDHKARPGSTKEAHTVKGWLEEQGLPTSVLKLKWPTAVEPLSLPNFETEARTLRFRALGVECFRLNIKELLMAHHRDDQAETVMGRIIQGYTGSGLAGIASETPIPECFGYAGAHNTVGPIARQDRIRFAGKPLMIHRPFLEYTKSQLRALCRKMQIGWKEDETNSDPTLTLRNAVRQLLSRNIPQALQSDSLVSMSETVARRNTQLREEVEQFVFKHMNFGYFDLRSGVMKVHIPTTMFLNQLKRNETQTTRRLGAAFAILADCVSPTGPMSFSQGLEIAERILQPPEEQQPFTVGEVYFCREYWERWESTWTLWRRPYPMSPHLNPSQPKRNLVWIKQVGTRKIQDVDAGRAKYGSWQLFDGRFWIRVWTSGDFSSLIVRPLELNDLKELKLVLSAKRREKLRARLVSAAPGDMIPRTLPALYTNKGDLIALPSIGMYTNDDPVFMHSIFWDVYYKWTDFHTKERGKINHDQSFALKKILRGFKELDGEFDEQNLVRKTFN